MPYKLLKHVGKKTLYWNGEKFQHDECLFSEPNDLMEHIKNAKKQSRKPILYVHGDHSEYV